MPFFIREKLGEKQALTPEGFLLCTDVPVARTGEMLYAAQEIPDVEPNADNMIVVTRSAEDVFAPEFLASLKGKSVVILHPEDGEDVIPDNWKELTFGIGMDPRQGEGEHSDCIIMDLMITDPEAIKLVRNKELIEISLGYDAQIEQIKPGYARQFGFIGNHIALVDEGRCGPRCSISDRKYSTNRGVRDMATKTKAQRKYQDALKKWKDAVRAKDAEAEEEAEKELRDAEAELKEEGKEEGKKEERDRRRDEEPEEGKGDTHIHVGGEKSKFTDEDIEAFMKKNDEEHAEFRREIEALKKGEKGTRDSEEKEKEIQDRMADEVAEEKKEDAKKARDSAILSDTFSETTSLAEIIAPGIRLPFFDAKADRVKMLDSICSLRRQALELAYSTPSGRGLIEELHGSSPNFTTLSCKDTRTLFRSVGAAKKRDNSNQYSGHGNHHDTGNHQTGNKQITSLADLNKANAARFRTQN